MPVTAHAFTSDLRPDEIERWRNVPVAIAVDLVWRIAQIDPGIRPLLPPGRQPRLFGRAVTAMAEPPDFGAVALAGDRIEPGDVLVIAAGGNAEHAMIGEILGGHVRRRGGVGMICDGAIRDVGELSKWSDFSVFARHITPRGPVSGERGMINAPVVCGGIAISPGDLLIGDDDGLVALTPELVRRCICDAEKKMKLEVGWQKALEAGGTMVQALGFAPAVEAK